VSELAKYNRNFIPKNFIVTNWNSLKPFFDQLVEREINALSDLRIWLQDRSELETIVSEDAGWRYIRMTCDTENEEKQQAYNFFITEIEPNIQPYSNKLDTKLLESPFKNEFSSKADQILVRSTENHHKTFREQNIPLLTEIQQGQVKYGNTVGSLQVTIDGEEMTLQKASIKLFDTDRNVRENAYNAIQNTRLIVKNDLDGLFNSLISLRNKVANNAGFSNFRDFMFVELCRFDYTPQDCFDFHQAIETEVVPLLNDLAIERKKGLDLEILKPFDLSVDIQNRTALKPFSTGKELTDKTVEVFNRIDKNIGQVIKSLEDNGHLDLESRKGKAPGGYNYPLYETGYPFIFMNSVGALRDLVTMVHEGGHALHSVLTHPLELVNYKNFPSEVAELASMSMELLSMEHWDVFFDDKEQLNRAKKEHLESIIETLPWVATIDKFQHWLYENPNHTVLERTNAWNEIHNLFISKEIDWTDLQAVKDNIWQKQLHLFEVPFYYIEYGMAQLGAIAVWKNFKENPAKGLKQYIEALKLGYTQSISEIYEVAGVKFDFSQKYIKELMDFVKLELKSLH
jgi:oligoendopeptidase F